MKCAARNPAGPEDKCDAGHPGWPNVPVGLIGGTYTGELATCRGQKPTVVTRSRQGVGRIDSSHDDKAHRRIERLQVIRVGRDYVSVRSASTDDDVRIDHISASA